MRRRRFEPRHMGPRRREQFLDDYGLTTEEFASAIGLSPARVERVLEGLEPIDADLALRLAKLFGGSGEGWLNWQTGHELWHAHESIAEELDAITPLDPDTRRSVREDEPLEPEQVEEIRRRLAKTRDPRRWVVVSTILDEAVPLHEESLSRMFYNVETDCYAMELRGATPFKSQEAAEAVAAVLGPRATALEVTKRDLEKPQRDRRVDRAVRDGFLKTAGHGMSEWDVATYLRDEADMVGYLEAAAEDGDRRLIATAVANVMEALTAQTRAEYLRDRGLLGNREAYEAALGCVADAPPDEGDEYEQ